MSRIKEYYHDEICSKSNQLDLLDADYQFEQFEAEIMNDFYGKEAEKNEFFKIAEITGSFPM